MSMGPDDFGEMRTTLRLANEHGVGGLTRKRLGDELGQEQLVLQRKIARVVDPQGILNPGKVFATHRFSSVGRFFT